MPSNYRTYRGADTVELGISYQIWNEGVVAHSHGQLLMRVAHPGLWFAEMAQLGPPCEGQSRHPANMT